MSETISTWAGIREVPWIPVLNETIKLGSHYKVVPTEGYIAWEYNPLRNYRLSQNMYEKDGKYYTEDEFFNLNSDYTKDSKDLPEGWTLYESGELVDFITNELSFNLSNPVEILPQYSYDGSVNLILNDGINIPRLINSRFTVTGQNTYKVIDRKGDNDTSIYDQGEQFDVDTSLFKNVNKIPQLEYLGTASGNMKIGNYHFYFKYSDADGNESDWVAESGLVSVFIGTNPQSTNTGVRDENSIKSVRFKLSNIDIGYSYVKVYYTRYSADIDSNLIVQAKRIDKNFLINNSGVCMILITGDENETEVTLEEINSSFDVIQNAKTQCTAGNRLFMANVHKSKIEYDLLSKLSLCFCPYKFEEPYPLIDGIDENYNINSVSHGYYDTKYIYDKTGYWPGELYRIGIVYILKDGSLSPVFNIRGATNIPIFNENVNVYKIEEDLKNNELSLSDILSEIDYSEDNYMIVKSIAPNENAKGVIQFSNDVASPFSIFGLNIRTNPKIINELKKYTKGFFFVRQKRIPLTLCQGIAVGLDNESRTPVLPSLKTTDTVLKDFSKENLKRTNVKTSNLNGINFISEGFLSRFKYTVKEKETNGWSDFGTTLGIIALATIATAVVIFTCGAGLAVAGAGLAAAWSGGMAALTGTTGIIAGSVAGAGVVAAAVTEVYQYTTRPRLNDLDQEELIGKNIPEDYDYEEEEESRILTHNIEDRYIIKDPNYVTTSALIVPDYQVNQPYYNQFLNGSTFSVQLTHEQSVHNFANHGYFSSKERHFYINNYDVQNDTTNYKVQLVGVPDGCPIKMIGETKYSARAGYPEEAFKYECQGSSYENDIDKKENSDIIRGYFGSYVGMKNYQGHETDQVNIMIPGYNENNLYNYIQLRMQDTSAFYAISDRIDINNINKNTSILAESESENKDFSEIYYRGDCYICQYTHRINRNFNDPSAPYNDVIIDEKTWKDNYDPENTEKYANINLGDVNAVQLGMWLTFTLRSSYNLNIRTIDKSNVDEYIMCGNYRSFYPNYGQLAHGSQKIPDSDQYNKGFSKSVSEKYYFEVPDVPYIKQEFQNRIIFSDIHINDAYKNGFRVIRTMNHKDFPMTYGSITKLVELKNALLVVFEHGIGLVTINNNAEHTSQILSDLTIISDMYGSQWKDSILKTPSGIYGVDTVAKKIWRVKNGQLEIISDFKVQEFLNQNITLSERELSPMIGIRNVKTFYNAFKHDIMFTFYDNLYGTTEKSWNLCWNEILSLFTTFYSWIPAEMQNIDNIPFSFNRDTVKSIAKLGISDHGNDYSDGVTLTNNILHIKNNTFDVVDKNLHLTYFNKQGIEQEYEFLNLKSIIPQTGFIGFLHLDNRTLPDNKVNYEIKYELLHDQQGNHKLFEIVNASVNVKEVNTLFEDGVTQINACYLKYVGGNVNELLSEIYYRNNEFHSYPDIDQNKLAPGPNNKIHTDKPIFKNKLGKRLLLPKNLQINPDKIVRYLNIKATIFIKNENVNNATSAYYEQLTNGSMITAGYFESKVALTTNFNLSLLSTDFWKHGQAGLIDITDKIYPTYWYGQQHPFEFECVVANNPEIHKIFTNLELVSNHVKPESFHYEIVGDCYDFSEDKPTMYFRQEALKALYQYNGYDIEYNPNFLEIEPKQHNRSADFPKYYSRWKSINDIYDSYKRFSAPMGFNYDHLAGAEIVYYPTRNEFRVWNHVEAIDVDSLSSELATSIIKANCRYLEDKWLISINPIIVTYKNEFKKPDPGESMFSKNDIGVYKYSSWVENQDGTALLPPINIQGTKLKEQPEKNIDFPQNENGQDNALYGLYNLEEWNKGEWKPIDPTKNSDRRETDVRGKFIKMRIRYSGEELAIIDFLNTIYQISFA